jgi:hypothetical protein
MELSAPRQLCDNCRIAVKATRQTPPQVRTSDGIFDYWLWERNSTGANYCCVVISWEQVLEAKARCRLCTLNFQKAVESQYYSHYERSTRVVAIKYKNEDANGIHSMIFRILCDDWRCNHRFDLPRIIIYPIESTSLVGTAAFFNAMIQADKYGDQGTTVSAHCGYRHQKYLSILGQLHGASFCTIALKCTTIVEVMNRSCLLGYLRLEASTPANITFG